MALPFTRHFTKLSFPNLGLVRFPEVQIDSAQRAALGLSPKASNELVLKKLAWSNYCRLRDAGQFDGIDESVIIERFKMEFATFRATGVVDYLLLVWDINRWCDEQGIVRGYGRGSAGGSLTLYCVGIVRANPMKHKVDFPRFLSEARMKPVIKEGVIYVDGKAAPDIDCDYEYLRRPEVVSYIERRYPGRVSKISTRLELTGKMALKDTLKVYGGFADEEAKVVSDLIEVKYGKVTPLYEAKETAGVKEWLAKDPRNVELYAMAQSIEGLTVAHGQHPSGVFISYDPLDGNIPLEMSRTGEPTTSYDMETVAGLGTKVDILGLRTLDLVAGTAKLAGITIDSINVNDPSIYKALQANDAYLGFFQISDGLTKQACRQIKPRNVDELAVVLAISRPGALKYIGQFAEYVAKGTVKPFYPGIDEVLQWTGGALVMQEQITYICRDVFGLSPVNADSVRAAISKKKREEMVKWESVIVENGAARGIPIDVVKSFWATCLASAEYSFNYSHSVLYSYLTAATIYLKSHYPLAFYLTMLKLAKEEPNPTEYMNQIISEMKVGGYKVLPPDIIASEADFTIEGDAVRFGLQSVKGVSETTMAKLSSFKRTFGTRFEVFEAAKAAKVNINTLVTLIYSGCLSAGTTTRSYLALNAQLYNLLTDREKPLVHKLASEYSEDLVAILKDMPNRKTEKGKPLISESRLTTLRRDYQPYWDQYVKNSGNEELCSYLMERSLLGFSYTSTLHTCYSRKVTGLTPLSDLVKAKEKAAALAEAPPPAAPPVEGEVAAVSVPPAPKPKREWREKPKPITIVAFVGESKKHLSRKDNTPYLKLTLFDDSATFRALLFGQERLDACLGYNGAIPTEGAIVIVTGSLSRDQGLLFADSCIVQPPPIAYRKVAAEETI